MKTDGSQEWQTIKDKQTKKMFQIITGQQFYQHQPFIHKDSTPDLIIKWRLPDPNKEQTISRSQFGDIGSFINYVDPSLRNAFEMATKKIIYQMQINKQNQNSNQVKVRYMQCLKDIDPAQAHHRKLMLETGGEQKVQLMCFDQKINRLDGITLYFNTFMYILQRVCGFEVRAFLINSRVEDKKGLLELVDLNFIKIIQKKSVKDIYLFLSLPLENMLKVANRFSIKKQVYYSQFDFHLNSPTTHDQRPIKYNTTLKRDEKRKIQMGKLQRFFGIRETNDSTIDLIEQTDLTLLEYQQFMSYWEQSYLIFEFLKENLKNSISNQEKIYLYYQNRHKINPGCENVLARLIKRKQYFFFQKDICQKYGYKVHDQPPFYQKFILPNKNIKGGFFEKLKQTIKYKYHKATPTGEVTLFNSMQRTKLCFLTIKTKFKLNYFCKKLGADILTLDNDFQKSGKGGENKEVKGGLDGTFLTERWHTFGLFSDSLKIRNYFGDVLGHSIMIKTLVVYYLFSISVIYGILYMYQRIYTDQIFFITTMFQSSIFMISFTIFASTVEDHEDQYSKSFTDNRHSTVFSSQFKGPYMRNLVTDQLNQYRQEEGFYPVLRNLACIFIFGVLAVIFGGIFHGCRMFLLQIHSDLFHLQSIYFSLSHLLSYSIYFILSSIFQSKLYDKIVKIMIYIKNPTSDCVQDYLRGYFTFYYLLTIELIPIYFFLIHQPILDRNSCYSDNCQIQFYYYIYARFIFNFTIVCFGFGYVLLFGLAKKKYVEMKKKQVQVVTFQDSLVQLFKASIQESQKQISQEGLSQDILSLFAFSFYCTQLPLVGVMAFGLVMVKYITTKITLLYYSRRPINKSQPIIRFSGYCKIIFLFGGVINIWVITFLLNYVQRDYQFIINMAPPPLNENTIILIKLLLTAFFLTFILILSLISKSIVSSSGLKSLIKRQYEKYKQHEQIFNGPNLKQSKSFHHRPIKNIFRTFNPSFMDHQFQMDRLIKIDNLHLAMHFQLQVLDKLHIFSPIPQEVKKKKKDKKGKKYLKEEIGSESDVRLKTQTPLFM